MAKHTVVDFSSLEGGEIDRDRIIDADLVSEEYFCPVCQYLLWKPRACSTCRHVFCEKCIQTWLDNPISKNRCPLRCEPFQDSPCPSDVQSALSRLNIRCRNASLGCSEILSYDQLEHHENVHCQFLTKHCPECEQLVPISKYDEHRRIEGLCHPCPIKCTICQNYFEKTLLREHFYQCFLEKQNEVIHRTLLNHNVQTENWNQALQQNDGMNFVQAFFNTYRLIDEQKRMSRLPSSFKGVDAVQRAREQNCGHLYHIWVMLKFYLLNWTKIPFFMINLMIGVLCVNFALVGGAYLLFCRWSCTNIYAGPLSLILFSCLSTYGTWFIFQQFSDQTIILSFVFFILVWSCVARGQLEAFEVSPLLNRNILSIVFCGLTLLVMELILLSIRCYFYLIPVPFATIVAICFNAYLALKIYGATINVTAATPVNQLVTPV